MYSAFSECCADAEKNDVRIAFEPINRYETSLLNTVEESLAFLNKVGSEKLGLLIDTFHMNIEEPSIEKSILAAKNHIYHFHYADSNRRYPGAGHLNFSSIISSLFSTGYSGFLSGEHRSDHNPEDTVKRGFLSIRNILSSLKI
jgi:sugar phosphate isomerase/epimerase